MHIEKMAANADPPSSVTTAHWLVEAAGTTHLSQYCDRHGCQHPSEVTDEDRPSSDSDPVRKLDQEALNEKTLTGKWLVFTTPDTVDSMWEDVLEYVLANDIWQAKVSTKRGRRRRNKDTHVIVVYTPNYFDTDDVFRVRDVLHEIGVEEELRYKPDIYTDRGIYPETAADWNLESAARYIG